MTPKQRAQVRYPDPTNVWDSYLNKEVIVPADPPYIRGLSIPTLADPLAPTKSDNVGWDGDLSGGIMSSQSGTTTVPANTEWVNRAINRNLVLTDFTSKLTNCIIYGGPKATNIPGIITANNGGQLDRCTIYGGNASVGYWTMGVSHYGGKLLVNRCAMYRVTDMIHTNGATAHLLCYDSLGGRYAFFDNDLNQSGGTPQYWGHTDFIQMIRGGGGVHEILGNKVDSFFETEGVTWSGGTWGSGVASGGVLGTPSTALNAGYWNAYGEGTWANGITFSNNPGFNVIINDNIIDGVNATSGLIQFTSQTGTTNIIELKRNQFKLAGKPTGAGKFYLISYLAGNTVTMGAGADVNYFSNSSRNPAYLRGTPIPLTATGSSIIP